MSLDGKANAIRGRRALLWSGAGATAAAAAVLALPLPAALAVAGLIAGAELSVIAALLATATRRARNVRVRRSLETAAAPVAVEEADPLAEERGQYREKWETRLRHGFSTSAIEPLLRTARNTTNPAEYRLETLEALDAWFQEDERARQAGVRRDVDVLIVSHFGLPGGNTSANVADITALTKAGLTVGLFHHPVYRWDVATPINPKIEAVVDGEQVVMVTAHDTVRTDLTIVRLPTIMGRLLDDLPSITTGRTVLLVNQVPFTYYDADGGRREQWDPRLVHETLQGWLGDHTWYLIGPEVRRTLERHHAEAIEGIDIADEYWFEIIDVDEWRREAHTPRTDPIRLGRHTRDAPLKWPETVEKLTAAYPVTPGFEVHALGGVATPREMLGDLPANWVDHPFGTVPARDFLLGLDVFVYFIAEDCVEAFGRSPLEAMAVGVPCVMDPRFEALFGEAALYCEPEAVADVVRKLVERPEAYRAQVERALRKVEADFSPAALVRRVVRLGVRSRRDGS